MCPPASWDEPAIALLKSRPVKEPVSGRTNEQPHSASAPPTPPPAGGQKPPSVAPWPVKGAEAAYWGPARGARGARDQACGWEPSALTSPLPQVGGGCCARPPAAHMALRGVSQRLLSRGPPLRLLRGWGSAAALTGQCRVAGGVGRVELETRRVFRGDFSSCVFREGREDSEPTGKM